MDITFETIVEITRPPCRCNCKIGAVPNVGFHAWNVAHWEDSRLANACLQISPQLWFWVVFEDIVYEHDLYSSFLVRILFCSLGRNLWGSGLCINGVDGKRASLVCREVFRPGLACPKASFVLYGAAYTCLGFIGFVFCNPTDF